MYIRMGDGDKAEWVQAEVVGENRARLAEIPLSQQATLDDIVAFDPATEQRDGERVSYALGNLITPGLPYYRVWAIMHRPQNAAAWQEEMAKASVLVQADAPITRNVRYLRVALPPKMTALAALARFNRNAQTVEIVSPLLASHADDWERAKSDLDRAVAWGGDDAHLTLAVAEAWEGVGKLDEAITFWERLTHVLPDDIWARERLGYNYASLGVYPHAALEFERAAALAETTEERQRLEAARDLMWQHSKR